MIFPVIWNKKEKGDAKGKYNIKAPAEFELMAKRIVVNAVTHCI